MDSKHIVIDARIRRSSTGRYTDRLIQHLQTLSTNHQFTVLVQPDDPWQPTAHNFEVAHSPFPQFSLNPLNDTKFAYQLNDLNADLVHFTMTQQPLTYRGKTVTTTHDLTMLRFVRAGKTPLPIFWLKRLGYRVLFYVANKKSSQVIVPSEFVANDLKKLYPFLDNVHITYESSEPPIKAASSPIEGLTDPFIMHVGSPFPHKNIQKLIEAFEIILADKPNLKLVLAGKKEFYFNELEDWARKRDSYDSILFAGFVSDPQLKWLYQNAEAYILPSLSEGFGLPGLEAMAHDCPLISSNATCLPEVYEDAAHYFDPTSTKDIADSITTVLNDQKLRKELIAKGKSQLKKYSWRTMAEQTLAIYDQALDLK